MPRIVPLSLRAIRILQTQAQTSDFVFPFTVDMVKEAFKRARARADATDLRLHDLRHEATSRLFERTTLRESGSVTSRGTPIRACSSATTTSEPPNSCSGSKRRSFDDR